MSVSRIFSGLSSASVGADSPAGEVQSSSLLAVFGLSRGVDPANIAQGAKTMGRLATLAKTDPERFKLAAGKIADRLGQKAQEVSEATRGIACAAGEREFLAGMAARFSDAAGSGSLGSLRPCAGAQEPVEDSSPGAQPLADPSVVCLRGVVDSVVAEILKSVGQSVPAASA